MTFVVTENCIKCKYTDCVEVCPVDCFYEGPNFLAIDPDECIDCALCEPRVSRRGHLLRGRSAGRSGRIPGNQCGYGRQVAQHHREKDAPPDADEWDGVPGKKQYLEEG